MLPRLALAGLVLAANPAQAAPGERTAALPISAPWPPRVLGVAAPPPLAAQPGLLFINFDGGEMNDCGVSSDPKNNCSWIFDGTVLPFSGDAGRRAAVVQYIRKDLEDFAIQVTDLRPADDVDYDMEMVGDWDPAPQGGFAGVAPSIDCFNSTGGEVSFTLDYTQNPGGIARAVLQEVAHTWGLEHVDAAADLLYPTTAGVADPSFADECFQIVALNPNNQPEPTFAECPSQHQQFCGAGDQQNSHRELLQLFGPHVPDLTAPTLSIVSPLPDAEIAGAFELEILTADEQSPQLLEVTIVGDGPSAFSTGPTPYPSPGDLKFPLKGLAPGPYTIHVEVADEEGNRASASVDFTVLGPAAPTTGEPGDDGSDEDASGTPTTGAPDPSTGASSEGGEPMAAGDDGCGCRQTGPGALVLFVPLLLARRGRARGARRGDRR